MQICHHMCQKVCDQNVLSLNYYQLLLLILLLCCESKTGPAAVASIAIPRSAVASAAVIRPVPTPSPTISQVTGYVRFLAQISFNALFKLTAFQIGSPFPIEL